MSKAYFFAEATRRVFVPIPEEDREAGDENNCALLLRSLYGTGDAALNWAECYTKKLLSLGFTKGASSPCTFFHPGRSIRMPVHGDDFVSEGQAIDLKWLDDALQKQFKMKSQVLGPDVGEVKELTILNRTVRWTPTGLTWEPDPRHAEAIIRDMGVVDGKGACSPGLKEESRRDKNEIKPSRAAAAAAAATAVCVDSCHNDRSADIGSGRLASPADEPAGGETNVNLRSCSRSRRLIEGGWQQVKIDEQGCQT